YYIFINTISDNTLVATGRINIFPSGVHFSNYLKVLSLKELPRAAALSLARTVIGTVFTLICASFPAYCFTRNEYWHKKLFYRMVIITMYFSAGVIPVFLTYKTLRIYDTFLVYILPCCVTPFNLILVKPYMESLPASLEESAEIDGAGYIVRFTRIIIPLCKPILATIAVFSAVGQWNNWMDTVLYTKSKTLQTLQYVLYRYLKEANTLAEIARDNPEVMQEMDPATMLSPLTIKYTICIVTILPILVVYPFFQKYFVKGMMIGAVKG
ncbi:MAG: carbohydrate ABC transporter permease, partial [Parasporobacterium sp.]|nr:carbohydrate ABC transporter permease [Parasporobacterium sp.]